MAVVALQALNSLRTQQTLMRASAPVAGNDHLPSTPTDSVDARGILSAKLYTNFETFVAGTKPGTDEARQRVQEYKQGRVAAATAGYETTPASYEQDVQSMVAATDKSVKGMIGRGERLDGPPLLNNFLAYWGSNDLKRCFPQAEQLRKDLGPTRLFGFTSDGNAPTTVTGPDGKVYANKGKWRSEIEELPLIKGVTEAGHYRIKVTPSDPDNTDIKSVHLDPWKQQYQVVYDDGRVFKGDTDQR